MAVLRESPWYQEILQEGEQAGRATGREEGREEERREVALNLLQEGMAIQTIARVTGLSIAQVQHLKAQLHA